MTKKFSLKIEYSIVFFVLLGIMLLLIPFSITNTRQATFISKWNEVYNRVEYMFSVINAHITEDMLKSMKGAKDANEREHILAMIVKPYLRVNMEKYPSKHYKPRYLNGIKISKTHPFYFDEFYYTERGTILGIKDVKTENPEDPFFMMMFDINGIIPPNRWGRDIYGINIYDNGRIEPLGYDKEMDFLNSDCSKTGTGVSCSYYYKIGGDFDD